MLQIYSGVYRYKGKNFLSKLYLKQNADNFLSNDQSPILKLTPYIISRD